MATEQKPLKSGFGARTTAREVLAGRDLTGKIAIVTGGYSGVGLETTRALAEAGATVVVPARTQEKARTALAGIPRVELETLELIDPASIEVFAGRFLDSGPPLDILINNAGIMAPPLRRDARGYESQFASDFTPQRPGQQPTGVLPWAIDADLAERLWHLSEKMTGAKFGG